MPLRSVEAATRDDAIAAAREQFGPHARVVGVRRVRSGGVLGFFATERYVAEVAPDPAADRPLMPQPSAPSSPLASAAPARARTTAPARNGAAAYAAVASASDSPAPAVAGRGEAPARSAAALRAPAVSDLSARAEQAADEARLGELARLLGTGTEPPAPLYNRASFPRATSVARPTRDRPTSSLPYDDLDDDYLLDDDRTVGPAVIASAAPSPFTAALARMVSGDRDVRQAVEEALEPPASSPSGALAGPWPTWSAPVRTAEPSVPSPPARQKEETVGDQVIAPPSMSAARPAEFPAWVADPEPQPAPAPAAAVAPEASSREEAIAEVLRSALAQGHSDEALAGILRKVLAGASPQTALTEPEPEPEPAEPEPALPDLAADLGEPIDGPSTDTVVEPPAMDVAAHQPIDEAPASEVAPVVAPVAAEDVAPVELPAVVAAPAPLPPAPRPMWGEPVSTSDLWGAPVAVPSAPVLADAPIWAEVVLREPVAKAAVPPAPVEDVAEEAVPAEPEAPVVETAVAEDVVADEVVAEEIVAEELLPETVAEDAVAEDAAAEVVAAESLVELAPLLARTASDPAPMSLDATTVMPPLSLLPPLPGMRGRGRPPVPPVVSRAASSAPAHSAPAPAVPDVALSPDPARNLATVTRLPLAPLMATPATPEVPELDELAEAVEALAVDLPAEPSVPDEPQWSVAPVPPVVAPRAPAASVPADRPVPVVREAPAEPGDVVAQLTALGVPAELLGTGFASDVAVQGTYAALTRALALRLPAAPELPVGAGEVLFVVGPGVETLRAARSLAAMLRLDPERVQWATRGDLAGLAPEPSRMATIDAAIDRRSAAAASGTVTIVAVDAPMRTDAYWMAQMLAIWSPVAVWAVVEATRKPEDLEQWLDGLSRVDALIVQDTDLSADPAAVLRRVAAPVALLDGVRATPHRWASLLCERLEGTQA